MAVGEDLAEALEAVLPHGRIIGSTQGFRERFRPAWTAGILLLMDPTSLEFWEWFYEPASEGASLSAEERRRATEERWHPDLVVDPEPRDAGDRRRVPRLRGSCGEHAGAARILGPRHLAPREVHDLGRDRYLY
jgi:hypothetical protein